jgi:hypothetical protein
VTDCDAALIFGKLESPGSRGLIRDCRALGKPWVHVLAGLRTPRIIAEDLAQSGVRVLLVAGNRESRQPGIGLRVERFLLSVFTLLGAERREA